jgi:hypothetical protein
MIDDLHIAQAEWQVGVARRACPRCSYPLIIRIPPPPDLRAASLRLGMDNLTPRERVVFDLIYEHFPYAVMSDTVATALGNGNQDAVALRMAISRLRHKLTPRGWLLIARFRTLRLVEPVKVGPNP